MYVFMCISYICSSHGVPSREDSWPDGISLPNDILK